MQLMARHEGSLRRDRRRQDGRIASNRNKGLAERTRSMSPSHGRTGTGGGIARWRESASGNGRHGGVAPFDPRWNMPAGGGDFEWFSVFDSFVGSEWRPAL